MPFKLPENFTIATVGEVRAGLLAALEESAVLELDASAVAEVDLAALQLICAAHREVNQRGGDIYFLPGKASAVIERAHEAAGIRASKDCPIGCPRERVHHG